MHPLDLTIFLVYTFAMLGIGIFFHIRNKNIDDFYVGGRSMGSWHIGFSVVATDVGGGFSIGLGGLGFAIGLSGSWMLFTGLLGAWLSAVFLIPKIKPLSDKKTFIHFHKYLNRFMMEELLLLQVLFPQLDILVLRVPNCLQVQNWPLLLSKD